MPIGDGPDGRTPVSLIGASLSDVNENNGTKLKRHKSWAGTETKTENSENSNESKIIEREPE
jgi:hypothetical protein